ncbi:hypothetical protein BJF90_06425 [Pseudonocardia sp. CNS-004]|nr:hypothetical protein BJF90_06425 [Pseudonocardia sp. CNS-004]
MRGEPPESCAYADAHEPGAEAWSDAVTDQECEQEVPALPVHEAPASAKPPVACAVAPTAIDGAAHRSSRIPLCTDGVTDWVVDKGPRGPMACGPSSLRMPLGCAAAVIRTAPSGPTATPRGVRQVSPPTGCAGLIPLR